MKWLEVLSSAVSVVGVVILLWGVVQGTVAFLRLEITHARRMMPIGAINGLRQNFGYYILLVLEFLIAADIIGTVARPSMKEITLLGATVAIRTVLSFFLDREIRTAAQNRGENS